MEFLAQNKQTDKQNKTNKTNSCPLPPKPKFFSQASKRETHMVSWKSSLLAWTYFEASLITRSSGIEECGEYDALQCCPYLFTNQSAVGIFIKFLIL